MKITAYNDILSSQIVSGDTIMDGTGTSGGSNGGFGPDLSGTFGNLNVIQLGGTVALGSNLSTGVAIGDELTIVSTSPNVIARFATPSNSGSSTGSNFVTRTLGGQETVVTVAASGASRTLDLGGGNLFDVTLTATPTTLAFSNVPASVESAITLLLRQDGSGGRTVTWPGSVTWSGGTAPTLQTGAAAVDVLALFTIDTGTTWYGFPTGGVSYGSNSSYIAEIPLVGTGQALARATHYHGGVGQITSSSSNTLQRGTVNFRAGPGIALTATDTDGNGVFDTVTIGGAGSGGGGGATIATVDANLSGDVTMTSANTQYDGPSGSFAPGTWLIMAQAVVVPTTTSNTHDISMRVWDGSTTYLECNQGRAPADTSGIGISVCAHGIVTLNSTTTLKISVYDVRAGSTLKRDIVNNGATSHNATRLVGYKVS